MFNFSRFSFQPHKNNAQTKSLLNSSLHKTSVSIVALITGGVVLTIAICKYDVLDFRLRSDYEIELKGKPLQTMCPEHKLCKPSEYYVDNASATILECY